jgi:uncharacterized Zn finger protein (UPF0148 family)
VSGLRRYVLLTTEDIAMTYHCSECLVNWWPYQARGGCCPTCGGGTTRRNEPASEEAVRMHKRPRTETELRDRYARFEAYYAEREQFGDAA